MEAEHNGVPRVDVVVCRTVHVERACAHGDVAVVRVVEHPRRAPAAPGLGLVALVLRHQAADEASDQGSDDDEGEDGRDEDLGTRQSGWVGGRGDARLTFVTPCETAFP